LDPTRQRGDVASGGESGEVDEMNADVADDALAAVLGREAPQPAVLATPIAPLLADQPALQVGGLEVPKRADLAVFDQLPSLLQRRRGAVGEVDHVDEAGLLGGI